MPERDPQNLNRRPRPVPHAVVAGTASTALLIALVGSVTGTTQRPVEPRTSQQAPQPHVPVAIADLLPDVEPVGPGDANHARLHHDIDLESLRSTSAPSRSGVREQTAAVAEPGPAQATVNASTSLAFSGYTPAPVRPEPAPAPEPVPEPVTEQPATVAASTQGVSESNSDTNQDEGSGVDDGGSQQPSQPEAPAQPAPPAAGGVLGIAASYVGYPYVLMGTPPSSFDCSGYVWWVHQQAGISIPRTVNGQKGAVVPVSNPAPGDLIFYNDFHHVGIYAGNGMTYEALNPSAGVRYGPLVNTNVWYGRLR